jgi:hypothetical protein
VGQERGPLSLMSTTEELFEEKSSSSSLSNQEYGHGAPLRSPCDTHYPQKLALTLPTSGGRSVSIVLLRAQAMEFSSFRHVHQRLFPLHPGLSVILMTINTQIDRGSVIG